MDILYVVISFICQVDIEDASYLLNITQLEPDADMVSLLNIDAIKLSLIEAMDDKEIQNNESPISSCISATEGAPNQGTLGGDNDEDEGEEICEGVDTEQNTVLAKEDEDEEDWTFSDNDDDDDDDDSRWYGLDVDDTTDGQQIIPIKHAEFTPEPKPPSDDDDDDCVNETEGCDGKMSRLKPSRIKADHRTWICQNCNALNSL